MNLICSVPSCGRAVYTIWRGYALCEACYDTALAIPDKITGGQMVDILSDVVEAEEDDDTEESLPTIMTRVCGEFDIPAGWFDQAVETSDEEE